MGKKLRRLDDKMSEEGMRKKRGGGDDEDAGPLFHILGFWAT